MLLHLTLIAAVKPNKYNTDKCYKKEKAKLSQAKPDVVGVAAPHALMREEASCRRGEQAKPAGVEEAPHQRPLRFRRLNSILLVAKTLIGPYLISGGT